MALNDKGTQQEGRITIEANKQKKKQSNNQTTSRILFLVLFCFACLLVHSFCLLVHILPEGVSEGAEEARAWHGLQGVGWTIYI